VWCVVVCSGGAWVVVVMGGTTHTSSPRRDLSTNTSDAAPHELNLSLAKESNLPLENSEAPSNGSVVKQKFWSITNYSGRLFF
jgi:hypothetical protein